MKVIKISNGEIRNGYELSDLVGAAADKAINEHWDFLLNTAETDEGAREINKAFIIESIEANDYLFDEEGELLPIVYIHGVNRVEIRFNHKYLCTIE